MHKCQVINSDIFVGVHVCPLSDIIDSSIFSELSKNGVRCLRVSRSSFGMTALAFIYK